MCNFQTCRDAEREYRNFKNFPLNMVDGITVLFLFPPENTLKIVLTLISESSKVER